MQADSLAARLKAIEETDFDGALLEVAKKMVSHQVSDFLNTNQSGLRRELESLSQGILKQSKSLVQAQDRIT